MRTKEGENIYLAKDLQYFASDWSALADVVTVDGITYRKLTAEMWDHLNRNIDGILAKAATPEQAEAIAEYYAEIILLVVEEMADGRPSVE